METKLNKKGFVSLVGVGIGSIGQTSLKAIECIKAADVIVHDRLLNQETLNYAKKICTLIDAGKKIGDHKIKQGDINQILVDEAKKGNYVVRLKGGDPYVFARGGEEGEYLYENDIAFEVVPGITSGIAALAFAGIPATHRNVSKSVTFITGHNSIEQEDSFAIYGKLLGTLVFYMSLKNIQKIVQDLLDGGMYKKRPAAIIYSGGYPNQKTFVGELENIPKIAEEIGYLSPSIFVVGEVVLQREKLNFFENRKLFGKKILVPTIKDDVRETETILIKKLSENGADVKKIDVLQIKPKKFNVIEAIKETDYLIFHSKYAVYYFMQEFLKEKDLRALFGIKICTVGDKTKEYLEKYNIKADLSPNKFNGTSLIELIQQDIAKIGKKDVTITLVHSSLTDTSYISKYKSIAKLKNYEIYENVQIDSEPLTDKYDAIAFTAGSLLESFVKKYGLGALEGMQLFFIGNKTRKIAKNLGISSGYVSEKAEYEFLADLIIEKLGDN